MLMARMLGALKVQVDVIVSSPLKRAMQTAQFVGTELGYDGKVEISPALAPTANFTEFQDMLVKYSGREGMLAVGHNPILFQFLGRLITGNGGAVYPPAQGLHRPRRSRSPSAAPAVAHRSAHRSQHLRQRRKKLPPENLAEVVRLFAQRPQFQLRTGASRLHLKINALGI